MVKGLNGPLTGCDLPRPRSVRLRRGAQSIVAPEIPLCLDSIAKRTGGLPIAYLMNIECSNTQWP
jgi:hypothetical protein